MHTRICPKCKNTINYPSPSLKNKADIKNSICKNCRSNQIPQHFTEEQLFFFNGLMLGDGGLTYSYKGSLYPRLNVCRQVQDKDYLFWQYELFKDFYGTEPKYYQTWHSKVEKYYDGYGSITKSGQVFKTQRERWYPQGKKIVPKDLQLSALTLLVWFLDDGCITTTNKKSLSIKFSTDGFIKKDVEFLSKLLGSFISDKLNVYKNGKGWILKGSTSAAVKIIEIIKDIFPKYMNRKCKWNNFDFDYYYSNPDQYGRGHSKYRIPGNAKLNWELVSQIRNLHANNKATIQELATQFCVSKSNILLIINNKAWIK